MRKAFLLAAILCLAPVLRAGFIDVICTFDDDPEGLYHTWEFVPGEQKVWLEESYTHTGTDSVNVSGTTDEDPVLWMTKAVTNENGLVWTAYSLTLSGGTFVSASSDLLPNVSISPDYDYVLFSGGTVEPGEILNMSFDVKVPIIGNFTFCLTQLAIPEPTSLLLLGLGGLGFLGRRR